MEGRTLLSFSAPISSPGGGIGLVVGDFNGDRRDDVAFFTSNGRVGVSLGNGDGTFRQSATLNGVTGDPLDISTGDVNGDGRADVVARGFRSATSNKRGSTGATSDGATPAGACLQSCGVPPAPVGTVYTTTWLGNGNGTFGGGTTTSYEAWYWPPIVITNRQSAEADFNHDATPDTASLSQGAVSLSLRNSDGTYRPAQVFAAGSNPISIVSGDFNGDGWADLAVANSNNGKVSIAVLLNDASW